MVQHAVDQLVCATLPFFGRSDSSNNELFRRWGVKRNTNDGSRTEFIERSRRFVTQQLGLAYPEVEVSWHG